MAGVVGNSLELEVEHRNHGLVVERGGDGVVVDNGELEVVGSRNQVVVGNSYSLDREQEVAKLVDHESCWKKSYY